MKSIAVLGLGIIALTTGAFITAGEAGTGSASPAARGSYFEAAVDGGVSARPSGDVAFGVVGDTASGVASFAITLDAGDSSGAILITSLDGRLPAPGRYPLSETAGSEGFRASYIAGSPLRPSGLFRAERGTLEITTSTPERIGGHFSFTAAGFHATDPSDEGSEVTVTGAFMSTLPPVVATGAHP
ncbi:MAG TPA: hypothetical protein VHG35_14855 [Gemmatimonadales bacterium]|nr:hypothetical protein [Gemmatimonadales bacterium]